MSLIRPTRVHLPSYLAALDRGWTSDHLRGVEAARDERLKISADPDGFLAAMDDRLATGGPVTLPDGSQVPRLPGIRRWMWDDHAPSGDGFAGTISLRWQPGTADLPPHCLGHIGYAVVPWKQRQGFAAQALRALLPEARALGLPHVELTTDPDNRPSQRVIEACGGRLVERFRKPAAFGGHQGLRYRIEL